MCALLHVHRAVPSKLTVCAYVAANHVLVYARKQKLCTRPAHCVVAEQNVRPLAQPDDWPARAHVHLVSVRNITVCVMGVALSFTC